MKTLKQISLSIYAGIMVTPVYFAFLLILIAMLFKDAEQGTMDVNFAGMLSGLLCIPLAVYWSYIIQNK